MSTPTAELTFQLVAQKRGYMIRHGEAEKAPGRFAELPTDPPSFTERTGTYAEMSAIAVRLNEAQLRASYLDYLYAVEPVGSTPAPTVDIALP